MDERIAVLETKFSELSKKFDQHVLETRAENQSLEAKLDSLLEIKNKGLGALWLISGLVGSGIIGGILSFIQWIKG